MRIPAQVLASCLAFLALSLISIATNAQNQEPSLAQVPRIRSEAKEVLVPVVVMDGRGRHISGLKASEFQVFEDGKPQHVVSFSTESMTRTLPVSSDSTAAGSERRLYRSSKNLDQRR